MSLKQFTEKIVVSDKLTAGNFAPAKGAPVSELIIKDHLPDELPLDSTVDSDAVASDAAAVDQPLLMAKADIELSPVSEYSGAVASDADFTYADHITSEVAEFAADQPELLAMNTVQHIVDSTVLPTETGGGISWGWIGAGAVAGGVGGYLLALEHGDSAGPVAAAAETVHVVVEKEGAFIDTANYGVRDAGEDTIADFGVGGNADLEGKAVFVHFNDVIDSDPKKAVFGSAQGPLDFAGFGSDDKVEIDVSGFLHNVWESTHGLRFFTDLEAEFHVDGGQSLPATQWERIFPTLDMRHYSADTSWQWGFITTSGPVISVSRITGDGSSYGNSMSFFRVGQFKDDYLIAFGSESAPTHPLASNLSGYVLAENQVDFVNLPVIVGINQNGAWYDVNDNGIRDAGELTGITDVDATNNTVVFHVYDVPMDAVEEVPAPIDVKGFGLDDRILIDADTLHYNGFADFDLFTNAVASRIRNSTPAFTGHSCSTLSNSFNSGDSAHWAGVSLKYNTDTNINTGSVNLISRNLDGNSTILNINSFSSKFFDGSNRFREVVDFVNPVQPHVE
jgi:hypothetical protein